MKALVFTLVAIGYLALFSFCLKIAMSDDVCIECQTYLDD